MVFEPSLHGADGLGLAGADHGLEVPDVGQSIANLERVASAIHDFPVALS